MTDIVLLLRNCSIPLGGTLSNSETFDGESMSAAWKARSGEFESRRRLSCRLAVIELGSSSIVRPSFRRLHRIVSCPGGSFSDPVEVPHVISSPPVLLSFSRIG